MSKINLRKNAFSETTENIPYVKGEKLDALLDRALELCGYPVDDSMRDHFQILVNGLKVDKELWGVVLVKESDSVLIAPILKRGDGGQLFKQLALIAVAVAASVFITPLGATALTGAIFAAGATIVGTLAINALIPPPTIDGIGGGRGGSLEESQMYSITGQSNSVHKYGKVPKVYGRHRIFPPLAAAPYTEVELDPEITPPTLVQNYYAVYDFGLGPSIIEDIKIGNTALEEFDNYEINHVDFKRPPFDEGEWDWGLYGSLAIYSGDVSVEPLSISIDKNQVNGGPEDDFQSIREVATFVDADQEIVLDFICPQGLVAHGTDGSTSKRTVTMNVMFSKVGEDVWHPFTDETKVYDWKASGGIGTTVLTSAVTPPPPPHHSQHNKNPVEPYNYTVIAEYEDYDRDESSTYYGYDPGATFVVLKTGQAIVGDKLYGTRHLVAGNQYFGTVASIAAHSATYSKYYLESPVPWKLSIVAIHQSSGLGMNGMYYNKPLNRQTTSFGGAIIEGETVKPVYASFSFKPIERAKYKVRITRVSSTSTKSFQILDRVTLTNITTRYFRNPIRTTKRHNFLELKIRATNQLNGTIQDLSAVATSVLDVYNPVAGIWQKKPTRNPAWVFVDLLTGSINKKALSKDRLHLPSILEWADFCDEIPMSPQLTEAYVEEVREPATGDNYERVGTPQYWSYISDTSGVQWKWDGVDLGYEGEGPVTVGEWTYHKGELGEYRDTLGQNWYGIYRTREVFVPATYAHEFTEPRFTCDFVLDYSTTLQDMINTVLSSAQASLNIIDGKYGVLVDKYKDTPVQIFTPRNSSDFTSSRNYDEPPHALKVRFVDSESWNTGEIIVYADGYDEETATEFDEISTFGCTNYHQAWRFGRYMMAQAKLRKETISIKVDFEHLVCTRGDYVQITQDVMKVGGTPARIKSIDGQRIVIDDAIETIDEPYVYGYTYRADDGQIYTSSLDVVSPDTFDLAPSVIPMPKVGDLIVIGELGKTTIDCIVKSISPEDDLSATLTLLEKADEIYEAESTGVLPDYDPQIAARSTIELTPGPVTNFSILDSGYVVVGKSYEYFVQLDWDAPATLSAYELFEIYVDSGSGYKLLTTTREMDYRYVVNHKDLGEIHKFKILAVSAKGNKILILNAPEVSVLVEKKTTPPSDVPDLFSSLSDSSLTLSWTNIPDADLKNYVIRYSSQKDASWESSTTLTHILAGTNSYVTPARTGTYLIKAEDLNGNRSISPALVVSEIEVLPDNILEEIEEEESFSGTHNQTENSIANSITLAKYAVGEDTIYYSEGFYSCPETVDLGTVAAVRINSYLSTNNSTELSFMENWSSLSEVESLALGTFSDGDTSVETQVRVRNSISDPWGPWTNFIDSEVTGRFLEFRLRLSSNSILVTPRVNSYFIEVDVPDRTEQLNNIVVPVGGLNVEYSTPFIGPDPSPSISITQDNAKAGDRYEITGKSLSGFTIKFYNNEDIEVERQVDITAKGYGHSVV